MKYLIKIDRSSIKKNPYSGQNVFYRCLGNPIVETECDKNNNLIEFSVRVPYETLYTLERQPRFNYTYEELLLKCSECGKEFSNKDLESFSDEDCDGNYYFNDRICPKCGTWDCCEIEYEKLSDDVLEKLVADEGVIDG